MKDVDSSTRLAIADIFGVTPLAIRNQDTQRNKEEVQHPLVIHQLVKTLLVKVCVYGRRFESRVYSLCPLSPSH